MDRDSKVPAELNLRDALAWAHYEGYQKAILVLQGAYPEMAELLRRQWMLENPPQILHTRWP